MAKQSGFTLIELMVTVAIVVIVSAIASQLYSGYFATASDAVLVQNISTMRLFQEDLRLRTGSYGAGTYDAAGGTTTLQASIGWAPSDPSDGIVYVVTTANSGQAWLATATGSDGTVICRRFPTGTCP